MKKLQTAIMALALALSVKANVNIRGTEYTIDTIARYQAGPGTWFTQVRLFRASDGGNREDVYLLQVDRRAPHVKHHTVLANDKLIGTERPSHMAERKTQPGAVYFAGTNGDFYNSDFRGFKNGVPDGTFITEGVIAHTPLLGREPQPSVIVDAENRFYFGENLNTDVFIIRGTDSVRCHHVNYDRLDDEIVLYNHYNDVTTLTDNSGSEARCRIPDDQQWSTNGQMTVYVEAVMPNSGNNTVDAQHIILSGTGTSKAYIESLNVGDTLTIGFNTSIADGIVHDYVCAFGGQDKPLMLKDGVAYETWPENHPRTAIGASVTGDTIMHIVVDGRGVSKGMTLGMLADVMRYFGAWNGMNMEGGGSSALYLKHRGVVNTVSQGSERAESNGFFAVTDAPEDNVITSIMSTIPFFTLPRYGGLMPTFYGYNQYGVMVDDDVQGVSLNCDPEVGYITENGYFVCTGEGILHAAYGDVNCDIDIRIDPNAAITLSTHALLIDNTHTYQPTISAEVTTGTIMVLPQAVTWSFSDSSIVTLSNDYTLTGVQNGSTWLYARIGDFADSMFIEVEIPDQPRLVADSMNRVETWDASGSSKALNATLSASSDGMTLTMTLGSGRNPQIKIAKDIVLYGLPHYIALQADLDGLVCSTMRCSITPKGASSPTPVQWKWATLNQGEDSCLVIDVEKAFEAWGDITYFPLTVNQLSFMIDGASPKREYHISLRGLYVYYDMPATGVDPIPVTQPSDGDRAHKQMRDGQVVIINGNERYTLTGSRWR